METRFKVSGMKCDGCIARAREALAQVEGVEDADFDLAAGTAIVRGSAAPETVAQALTGVGYPASVDST